MSELMENPIYSDDFISEQEEGFTVTDDQTAEWCLQKIKDEIAEADKWTEFYAQQMQRILARKNYRIAFFEGRLHRYFNNVPHKVTKTQESYQLPSGKLVMKQQKPEYTRDDEQLLAWLHQNNLQGFIQVKESVDWAGLKKILTDLQAPDESTGCLIDADGEIVPGITVTKRPDVFKVEVK